MAALYCFSTILTLLLGGTQDDCMAGRPKIGARKHRRLVLLDFDDTIVLNYYARKAAAKEVTGRSMREPEIRRLERQIKSQVYHLAATKYMTMMIPNRKVISMIEREKAKKEVIILTARLSNIEDETRSLLKKYSIAYDRLIMRDVSLEHMEYAVWKTREIKRLLSSYERIYLYEDRLDNIKHFRAKFGDSKIRYFHVVKSSISQID